MIRHGYAAIALGALLAIGFAGAAETGALPPAEKETVRTAQGLVKLFYRTAVVESDLEMPIYQPGELLESGAYRVRDRKNRDLLHYVFVTFRTEERQETVAGYYLAALGEDARRETDKNSGEVTVFSGGKDDCRIATLTLREGYCHLKLERVQRFTLPPRVYDAREQQVIRVLDEVAGAYRAARRVAYSAVQRVGMTPALNAPAPDLTWSVDFVRPTQLTVTAAVKDTVGLRIVTRDGKLIVTRQRGEPEERAIEHTITSALAPEMDGDTVARLMLGDALISDAVDYLGLAPVGDEPLHRQVEAVLTFPDDATTLRLRIDRQRNIITRSETIVAREEGRSRVVRTYSAIVVEPAATPANPTPPTATTP